MISIYWMDTYCISICVVPFDLLLRNVIGSAVNNKWLVGTVYHSQYVKMPDLQWWSGSKLRYHFINDHAAYNAKFEEGKSV
jgi:hypothetical protein